MEIEAARMLPASLVRDISSLIKRLEEEMG